ncbi:MAG TPA: 2-oxoacid:acceptor oxidoreductase subunit alpha, partial [Eubacteriaceae bacterium]|nr:2-oxoacid:acceptor oxidoreductase subunit alpha [Eubacteriaceae bacterium]
DTLVIGGEGFSDEEHMQKIGASYQAFDFGTMSKEAGGKIFLNTVLFGFTCGMLQLPSDLGAKNIREKFGSKGEEIVQSNSMAFDLGYKKGETIGFAMDVMPSSQVKDKMVLDGTTAVGIGALAGGCNFVSTYPMSPGTAVLQYLAEKGDEFGVFVEQAEDEIAAVNMVIGAWYAGARAMATTSGGGFALMVEGISLSAMTETPCVVHIGQRPGPATGLPTRTEQGDLNLALYAGHGEFPRIILAPATLKDGIELAQQAFYLADKYQSPVILLTDQFFLESKGLLEPFELNPKFLEDFIIETDSDYKRYDLSKGTLSPRGIPGNGKGFVAVDSDEHEENGRITEDFDTRVQMHEKRLAKKDQMLDDYVTEELVGDPKYKHLIVGWGSTYGVIKEYIETHEEEVAFLNIKQLYPLPNRLKEYFEKASKVIAVEGNSSGQLADLLKKELDVTVDKKVLKYSGEQIAIEELEAELKEVLG